MQHEKVGKTAEEEMQHETVGKNADEEMQHERAGKTAEEEMQLEKVTPDCEASYYEVTRIKSKGDNFNVKLNTCADIAENAQVGHVTKDIEDATKKEAEHHTTDDDDGRMREEQYISEM